MADVRTAAVMEALASVYDPCCQEKGLSVVDMGLVRRVALDGERPRVELLLTTGWCPFAANLIGVHKGVPLGPQPIEATQTWDMDGAAANFPEINFVIFHVGCRSSTRSAGS